MMALLHHNVPRAHVYLGDGTSDDKIDGWFLHTDATHQVIRRREFFSKLNTDGHGFIKFGDFSVVVIKGIGSTVLVATTSEHRLLASVYYILSLRNSIISLG